MKISTSPKLRRVNTNGIKFWKVKTNSRDQTTVFWNTFVSECLEAEWEFCNLFWPSAEQLSQKKWLSRLASSTVMSIQAGWNLNKKNTMLKTAFFTRKHTNIHTKIHCKTNRHWTQKSSIYDELAIKLMVSR